MAKSIQEMSVDTRILMDHLKEVGVGETIAYTTLTRAIRRDVTKEAYGNLATARKALLREHQMVFGVVRGVGLKRLNDSEIATSGDYYRQAIHRKSQAGIKALSCVQEFTKLGQDEQIKHNASMSYLGAVYVATKPSMVKKLETKIGDTGGKLCLADTLEICK